MKPGRFLSFVPHSLQFKMLGFHSSSKDGLDKIYKLLVVNVSSVRIVDDEPDEDDIQHCTGRGGVTG